MKSSIAHQPALPSLLLRFREEISRCVKCGACRAVCPPFLLERQESLSPRGRIALIRAVLEGRLGVSSIYKDRLATCTGCLSCEAACPNGVPVGRIIQAAKEQALLESGAGLITAAMSEVLKHPSLLSAAAWLAPLLLHYSGGYDTKDRGHRGRYSVGTLRSLKTAGGARGSKGTVAFFPGCAVERFQPDIGRAAISVLNRIGYEVIIPKDLKCCGRPLLSLGDRRSAAELAEHNSTLFAKLEADAIVTACASCSLTFKQEYPRLLAPRRRPIVLDIHEFLFPRLIATEPGPLKKTVTWHDPCHLGRGQGLSGTARGILAAIPGLTLIEMRNADRCCGFGGVMRMTHRVISDGIAEEKAKSIVSTGVSTVVTGCPGCRLQIADCLRRKACDIEVVHTVQLLDEAYEMRNEDQVAEALCGAGDS